MAHCQHTLAAAAVLALQLPTCCHHIENVDMQVETNLVRGTPPYKELKGEGSVSDQAKEAWDYARSRSKSVVGDIFTGQLQSTLQCPACGACSHTFEEFQDISLELPRKSEEGATTSIQVNCACSHSSMTCMTVTDV